MQRVAAVDVLNLLAAEGAHAAFVREALDASEVWQAYRDRKHDLYLPAAKPQVCSAVAYAPICILYHRPSFFCQIKLLATA